MNTEYIHIQFDKIQEDQTGYSSFFNLNNFETQNQETVEKFQKLLEKNQESNKLIVEFQNTQAELFKHFNENLAKFKGILKVSNIIVLIKNFNYGKYFLEGSYKLVIDFLDNFRECVKNLEINMGILFKNVEELSHLQTFFSNASQLTSFTIILKQQENSETALLLISSALSQRLDSWNKLNFNFEQTSLNPTNFRAISQQIQQCTNLNSLSINLYYNKLDTSIGNDLSLLLSQAATLETLFLDISDNVIGEGILPICEAVKSHKKLKKLQLFSRSNFIKQLIKELLISINQNKSLENVQIISRNNAVSGIVFGEGELVQNTTLTSLNYNIQEFSMLQIQKQILKYFSFFSQISNIDFQASLLLSADPLSIKQVFETLFSLQYLTSFTMTCNRLMNRFEQKIFISDYILSRKRTLYQMTAFQKYISKELIFSPIQTFFDIQFEA